MINDNTIMKGFAKALKSLFVERSKQEVFSKGSTRSNQLYDCLLVGSQKAKLLMFMRVVVVKCGKKAWVLCYKFGLLWTFHKIKKVCFSAWGKSVGVPLIFNFNFFLIIQFCSNS